jgi:hypothetical protein
MSDKIIFDSVDAVKQSIHTGNREQDLAKTNEYINAILSGNVEIGTTEQPQDNVPVSTDTPISEVPLEGTVTEPVIEQPSIDVTEYERQKKYNEFLEKKAQEEHNRAMFELKRREEELAKERAAKEELEKKLQQLSAIKQNEPSNSITTQEEDDEYASEYAKRTRQMVEDLKNRVGDNPVVDELVTKINEIQSDFQQRKQAEAREKAEREQREKENRVFENIRDFQRRFPELQTSKDIKDIDQEYTNFRKDIAFLINAKESYQVDKAIEDYFKGGEVRKQADERGIKAIPDFEKYNNIADLIDIKNGIQRDPITGQYVPILDDDGVQVRYRSLDEVYKLKNHENEIINARKQSYHEISKKLETLQNVNVTIKPDKTSPIAGGYTPEQEREILNWKPEVWIRDPDKRRVVEEIYTKHGLELPHYRGRR